MFSGAPFARFELSLVFINMKLNATTIDITIAADSLNGVFDQKFQSALFDLGTYILSKHMCF